MKKTIKKILIGLLSATMLCSCSTTEQISESASSSLVITEVMPLPFGEAGDGTGGDENANYIQPGIYKLDVLTGPFMDLRKDEVSEWAKKLDGDGIGTSLMSYANVFSFIMDFDITDDEIYKVFNETNKIYENYNTSHVLIMSDEDLEILCSRDEAKVIEHFASEYSIVNNGKIYSAQWIYTHTEQDYLDEKIPSELITEKKEKYKEIAFVKDSLDAFNKKIDNYSEYCEKEKLFESVADNS